MEYFTDCGDSSGIVELVQILWREFWDCGVSSGFAKHRIKHSWSVHYFFGKSALSALRFLLRLSASALALQDFTTKMKKTFISGKS